ncbi:MAG TPA: arginase family protein [Solirubrobacterales bacterium]|nr:arginase family protein [Solirubrobacterales bacterium]
MARWAIVDAPLDCSGAGRGEERAPAALRAAGLVERLRARDAGEADARVRDTRRDPDTGVVGAVDVRRASTAIASRVGEVFEARERPLIVGGDCTLLLGVFQALSRGCGLWIVDGHADFFDGESSPTGEAADMDLAILTGHGPQGLLEREEPLLEPAAVVLLGHRPAELHPDVARENARLDPAIHALTAPEVRERGAAGVGTDAAARLAERPAWLHLDLDVLDVSALPAVSYPQSLGLDWDELVALLRPLVAAPNLLGASVADFNPDRDINGTYAARVVQALESLCGTLDL